MACAVVLALTALVSLGQEVPAAPSAEARAMISEMRELFGSAGSMAPGQPGNMALEAEVARRFAKSGFATGSIPFSAPVFVPGRTVLTRTNEAPVTLYTMHPTMYRPGNFAESEFAADLVYLGKGEYEDLARVKGSQLEGAIALMDFNCGARWRDLLRFGVSGFVFIGAPSYEYADSYSKVYNTEVSVPRFFAEAESGGKLKAACLAAEKDAFAIRVDVQSEPSRFQPGELKDLWVLVPGSDPELGKEIVLFTARMDANSVVPELATGGQAAINPYLMLKMLEDFTAKPPKRSVLLVAVNAHTQAHLGERILAWHLLADSNDAAKLRGEMAREMRVARLYSENYGLLKLAPVSLDQGRLFAAVEILTQLDLKRQAQRKAQRDAAKDGVPALEATPAATNANAEISEVDTNDVLDLAVFEERDYREAIERGVKAAREEEKGSFFSRRMRDEKMDLALAQERQWLESMEGMPYAEILEMAQLAKPVFDDEKLFESWRIDLDSSSGQRLSVKKEIQTAAMKTKNALLQERIRATRDKQLSEAERSARLADVEQRRVDATRVLVMFNKIDFGIGRRKVRYRDIAANEAQRTLLKRYRDELTEKFSFWQRHHRGRLEADAAGDSVRDQLGGGKVVLALTLEMTANSGKLAFSASCPGFEPSWQKNFGQFVSGIVGNLSSNRADRWTPYVDSLNPVPGLQQVDLLYSTDSAVRYFVAAKNGVQGCGTPALALKNALAGKGRVFSPGDTLEALDAQQIFDQQAWLREFLPALLNDPKMTARENLDVTLVGHGATFDTSRGLWSTLLGTFAMEEMTANIVPEKALPGCMVVLYSKADPTAAANFLLDGDVVNCYAAMSDITGKAVVYGIAEGGGMAPLAYQMDKNWRQVVEALDKGRIQTTMQMDSNIARDPAKTLPMFPCREFPILDRVDPTLVGTEPITVATIWPKIGSSKSDPAKYGVHGFFLPNSVWSHAASGPGAVYLNRKDGAAAQESLMVITEKKRCSINATPEKPEGTGYATAGELGSDLFAHTAEDMDSLNGFRRNRLKGVANSLVERFIGEGKKSLQAMDVARRAKDHGAFLQANYRALGSEIKAYLQLSAMNADMLKAIILYMALMLPFCFFIQKLLFDFDLLQHELLAFSGCFVAMYSLFRVIHPAFTVAETPEAIFIAFVLGAIGLFVTMIMHSRFKSDMQMIFGKVGGIGDDAAYGTVGTTAMMVGIHNMRRRRVRTVLTTSTVMLVIFTMLTFSSVSQRLDPTLIRKASDAPYTGLFFHWPGGKNMDQDTVNVLRNIFSDRADVVVRRTMALTGAWPIEPVGGGRSESATNLIHGIKSLVGLPSNDRVFAMSRPLVAGRHFSADDASEIILPAKAAEAMNLSVADVGRTTLRFHGADLALVGIADDQRLRLVRDMNPNLPFLPFLANQAMGGPKKDPESLEIAEDDVSAIVADTASLVLLPATVAKNCGALPHSVSVRFLDEVVAGPGFHLWEEMDRLLTITHARFYIGSESAFKANSEAERVTQAGIYFVNSNYRTSIGGLARLIIPLLIAGLIILNTMLGTVYERKSEIAIYNAIGLNPTHIFMFFLAEAFVYSFIGSVGGYLIGQSLAMTLQHFHLIRDIGVNFSSLMVVYAILFTIGLVLLSTIYPAYVATRTAVPSGKRRWSMPAHDGHTMDVAFPFIYEGSLSSGVMYYIYEDFLACTEKSLGSVIATFESKAVTTDAEGMPVYALTYSIGLAPFDLGVTQRVKFVARYEKRVSSYRLSVSIEHLSGLDSNWVSLNRTFLERMRKFLMVWRNMPPAMYGWYSDCGKKLYLDQPLPTKPERAVQ
jgi:hypothetical protein